MKKGCLLLICIVTLFCLIGCGGPTEIDINSYVEVEFQGYDTLGQIAEYEFDVKQMKSDYEDALGEVSKKTIEKLFQDAISFEDAEKLKNGDEVTVVWDIDEDDLAEFEEEHKVKLIYDEFTVEVKGLEELESFDPFEKIYVQYEGTAPCATAYISKEMSRDDIGYYDFSYTLDKTDNLSNGDVVTVTVTTYSDADFEKFCIENYGKIPSAQTKTFSVNGRPEYVRNLEDIPAADLAAMDEYIQNILKEKTADWVYPDSFYGMTLMGNAFAEKFYKDYYSYVENTLYFVYKVDIDSVVDGAFDYYYYGYINNLTLDENGGLKYQLHDISVPSGGGWFSSGTTFEYGNLVYEGYRTYDELYAAMLEPLATKYDTVVNNVDKNIVTQVTHEPNDYSVITDVLALSSDCFTYKWHLGSYFVSGLTQKGYDEIMKYKTADYVSIQLPAMTEDGSVVEGFYSSGAEGGYAFSKLVCEDAPRFELVCADNYITFYGFCDDNRFSSSYMFKMKNIKLNEGLKDIKAGAFKNCNSLESVTLPEGIEIIPESLFVNCTALKEVNIPATVTEIQKYAFENCTSLVFDSLELGTLKVGYNAFDGVTINKLILNGNDYIPQHEYSWGTTYNSMMGAVVKELVVTETVTQIPDYAFEGIKGVSELTLPGSVLSIGTCAFAGCSDLTKVTLQEGLETIGVEAFKNCTSLKTVNIPDSVTTIEDYAFADCTVLSIERLEIGSKKICANVFENVTIQEVVLNSEECILEREYSWGSLYAPFNNAYVKKITIADNITKVPDYAFEAAKGITELVIPANVKEIGVRAFADCPDLVKVTLSEGLETIGVEAFENCDNFKTVSIPSSVLVIDDYAFASCDILALERFEIGSKRLCANIFENVTIKEVVVDSEECVIEREYSWGSLFAPFNNAYVKTITVGENITKIPDYLFEGAEGFTELILPATVVDIGVRTFADCDNLTKVVLPDGLATIGAEAFEDSDELRTIDIPASVKTIGESAFYSINDLTINTTAGSTAETYAKEHGINVKVSE